MSDGLVRPIPIAVREREDQDVAPTSQSITRCCNEYCKCCGRRSNSKRNFHVATDEDSVCYPLDPCGCCVTKAQTKDGTLCNRLIMCAFAVALLWAASLQTAIYISNSTISSPEFDSVVSSCQSLEDDAETERESYLECVERLLDNCDEIFQAQLDAQVEATNTQLSDNADFIDEVYDYQKSCSESFTTGQAAISEWLETGISYVLEYTCPPDDDDSPNPYCNVSCSYDDDASCSCAEVADMVGDISALRATAFKTSTEYKDTSRSTVSSMASYATARAKYDAEYSYNKTDPARQAFNDALENVNTPNVLGINQSFYDLFPDAELSMGCLSMRDDVNNSGCYPGVDGLRSVYAEVRELWDDSVAVAQEGFEEFYDEADDFVSAVASSFDAFAKFYDGVMSLGIEYDDGLSWVNFGISDFIVSSPVWPSSVGILTDVDSVPGGDYIYKQVSGVYDEFVANISLASFETTKLAEAFADDLAQTADALPELSPDDYNPPEYSDYSDDDATTPDEADENHETESDVFISEHSNTINAFAELQNENADDDGLTTFNVTFTDDFEFLSSAVFQFEEFVKSTVDVDYFTFNIGNLATLFLFFDYAYRIAQTLYYIRLFWSRAGVSLPPIDIRYDKYELEAFGGGSGASDAGSGCDCGGSFMCCALCPCWAPCICLFFMILIVIQLVFIYVPIFNDYHEYCVQKDGNGTFLVRNLYSLAYNYASDDGNDAYYNGIEDYNENKADLCGEYATFSQEQQQEDEIFLRSLRDSHFDTRDDMFMMAQCINTTAMDRDFELACCGETYYTNVKCDRRFNYTCPRDFSGTPYKRLSTLIGDSACLEDPNDWYIDDASLYCSDLPDCQIYPNCNGPNKEILKSQSTQCGCMIEWLLHSWWMQTVGVVLVYVIMNVSRLVIVDALCKIFWRAMSPNCFTYLATTSYNGQFLGPPGGEKYQSFKRMLHEELQRELRLYGRSAYVQLVLGCAMNYGWIYFLYFVNDRIYYDPNDT